MIMPPFNGGAAFGGTAFLSKFCIIDRNYFTCIMICQNPKRIRNIYTGEYQWVSCGKCVACLSKKQSILATRIANECDSHKYNIFFTLTYSNENIPYIKLNDSSIYRGLSNPVKIDTFDGVVDSCKPNIFKKVGFNRYELVTDDCFAVCYYKDVQNFLKRLRNEISEYFSPSLFESEDYKLRYVVTTEYGPTRYRPHIHGIFHTNNPDLSKFLFKAILACWKFCDWSELQRANTDYLPSLIRGEGGSKYVSKYTSKFDTSFTLVEICDFRPTVKYSKIPYYGLSAFDREVVEKIVYGSDFSFTKNIIGKSNSITTIFTSQFLQDFLFGKSPKYVLKSDWCSIQKIVFNSKSEPKPFLDFIQRIRKLILSFFPTITETIVFIVLQRIKNFIYKYRNFVLTKEIEEGQTLTSIQYVSRKFQSFSNLFDCASFSDHHIAENPYTGLRRFYSVKNLYNVLSNYGIDLFDYLVLLSTNPKNIFASKISYVINKHYSSLSKRLL